MGSTPITALSGVLVSRISSGPMSGSHGVSEGLLSGSRVSDAPWSHCDKGAGWEESVCSPDLFWIFWFSGKHYWSHFLCELKVQVSKLTLLFICLSNRARQAETRRERAWKEQKPQPWWERWRWKGTLLFFSIFLRHNIPLAGISYSDFSTTFLSGNFQTHPRVRERVANLVFSSTFISYQPMTRHVLPKPQLFSLPSLTLVNRSQSYYWNINRSASIRCFLLKRKRSLFKHHHRDFPSGPAADFTLQCRGCRS